MLILTAPLFAYRGLADQARLARAGLLPADAARARACRQFTALKFRTMQVDTDDAAHREYIQATMTASASPTRERPLQARPLGRDHAVRPLAAQDEPRRAAAADQRAPRRHVARRPAAVHRRTRPSTSRRTTSSASSSRPGITGLWQVTARAHSTFGEALDMDVAYARGWSLGLDLRLLCRPRSRSRTGRRRLMRTRDVRRVPTRTVVSGEARPGRRRRPRLLGAEPRAQPARAPGGRGRGRLRPATRARSTRSHGAIRRCADDEASSASSPTRRSRRSRSRRRSRRITSSPRRALEAGKHVFVEKPLAASSTQRRST